MEGAGEMARKSRALAAPQDLSLVPSTHIQWPQNPKTPAPGLQASRIT